MSYFGELWFTFAGAQIFDSRYLIHFLLQCNDTLVGKENSRTAPSPWDFVTLPGEDRAMSIGNKHRKIGKDHACGSGHIVADRQTDTQTYVLITILRHRHSTYACEADAATSLMQCQRAARQSEVTRRSFECISVCIWMLHMLLRLKNVHRVRKNWTTLFLPLTLPNAGQFSTFFHHQP